MDQNVGLFGYILKLMILMGILGFHDDDMQICIKKEPIDPSSPTRNAELNFPKRSMTLNSSNLSNSNSVETSVINESDITDTEDAVETSVRSEIETTETENTVETSDETEIESTNNIKIAQNIRPKRSLKSLETEDIVEKSIRSEIDTAETENTVETSVRSEIDETDIDSTNNIKIAQNIRPKRSLKSFKENIATTIKLRTRNSSKKSKKSTCDGDYLSTSPEKSNNEKLDKSSFKPNNKSTLSHLQNHIQIKNTLLTSKSRRSQSQFKSLQLDNSSETYDNSEPTLKSPNKKKRSPRSIRPKLLPTIRNKSQLSKNDLSFTSNRSTSTAEDVHEKKKV
ncbi:hypothetical protein Anas_07788 [Armadillidium nasatum]|uniref:Uncharacterized protein n=1 Tax=Armadillidium nasatum TaxID=96803 RepID=A0A5N5SUN2_9CRUS|nr:hypothetical protein Anas_07788 [Armadillidium nasatum]